MFTRRHYARRLWQYFCFFLRTVVVSLCVWIAARELSQCDAMLYCRTLGIMKELGGRRSPGGGQNGIRPTGEMR